MSNKYKFKGYRIDGVAACRLAWQWFWNEGGKSTMGRLPEKSQFVNREVAEPWSVRLVGECDIWDKRDPNAELFQHGLRARQSFDWELMLTVQGRSEHFKAEDYIDSILKDGKIIEGVRNREYREVIISQGFDLNWEGYKFLACNSHELDIRSQLFEAGIKPHHDGLIGFTFNGKDWSVSLYGVPGKPDIDLSKISVKYGGGGHKQACGFRISALPWL